MTILHMGIILMSVGATIYVALKLLNVVDTAKESNNSETLFRMKHEKEYVFYVVDKDRIIVRQALPSECAKMLIDTPNLMLLGEL